MSLTLENQTVNAAFFQPITGLARRSSHARACPDFSADDYLECGSLRVLESSTSGRAFLQEHGARLNHRPPPANYFATLHSPRRGAVVADVNNACGSWPIKPCQTGWRAWSSWPRMRSLPWLATGTKRPAMIPGTTA